jgi:hypothetical protein
MFVHQQVPRDLPGRITIRLYAARTDFAIEQKRKLEREHARLARAIVAAD